MSPPTSTACWSFLLLPLLPTHKKRFRHQVAFAISQVSFAISQVTFAISQVAFAISQVAFAIAQFPLCAQSSRPTLALHVVFAIPNLPKTQTTIATTTTTIKSRRSRRAEVTQGGVYIRQQRSFGRPIFQHGVAMLTDFHQERKCVRPFFA